MARGMSKGEQDCGGGAVSRDGEWRRISANAEEDFDWHQQYVLLIHSQQELYFGHLCGPRTGKQWQNTLSIPIGLLLLKWVCCL